MVNELQVESEKNAVRNADVILGSPAYVRAVLPMAWYEKLAA